jgi:hypothetical protein
MVMTMKNGVLWDVTPRGLALGISSQRVSVASYS